MLRSLFLAVAVLGTLAPGATAAQSAAPPFEIGLDASALLTPDRGSLGRGPRLVVNFDGRNALEVKTSLRALSSFDVPGQQQTDLYLAAYKRVVHAAGPVRVFASIGGGVERTRISVPGTSWPGPPPVFFPPSSARQLLPAFTSGGGLDIRLGSRAAVVLESSVVITGRLTGRLSGGLVVPVGRYPSGPHGLPTSVPWADLSEGDRVWVTTADGHEVAGEVILRSARRLDIRTGSRLVSLAPDDVRAIDTTDPIRNGVVLGAMIGGVGALAPSAFITYVLCAFEEECRVGDVLLVNGFFVGLGAGIGAATGAIADSLRERRAPLYRRGSTVGITVAPLLRKGSVGVGGGIRW